MEQSELLRFVVSVLERLDLPYFVTGSMATIFYGEPRFTNDIDMGRHVGACRDLASRSRQNARAMSPGGDARG